MSSNAWRRVAKAAAEGIRAPRKMSYSQWAAAEFRLSAEASAETGRFKPWKPQRGILDAIGDPNYPFVTVMKSARTGYTKSIVASIGAAAINDPGPGMLLVPTDDDARDMAVTEIDPAFRDSPALRDIMRHGRLDGRNTLTQRTMMGGASLKILSARSPRNLRRHTIKNLWIDEVDGMEVTKEGDPVDLSIRRTLSYSDRKIVMGSTPTEEAVSRIAKGYKESDQRIFKVPCPHCEHRFEMLWEHVDWPPDDPFGAYVVCPSCGAVIEERFKAWMVENGDWVVTAPKVRGHAGFRMNALISLFANASWGNLADEYVKARRAGPSRLQVFTNTVLGLPWSQTMDVVDEMKLMARAEPFGISWVENEDRYSARIPQEVMFITCGVDVQADRFEATLWGWSQQERWVLGHHIIRGATNLVSTWDELDWFLQMRWPHPLGNDIGIEAVAIDSGDGNRTQFVYDFCGARLGRKVFAIKGVPGAKPVIEASKSRLTKARGARLYLIGVEQVKTDLLTSMNAERGQPMSIRFSDTLPEEWFIQFTSERRKVEYRKGRPVVEFVRIGYRSAEALDASVYAVAVRSLCRFDYGRRQQELTKDAPTMRRKSLGSVAARLNG